MNKTINILLIATKIIIPFTNIYASENNNAEQSRRNNGPSQIFINVREDEKLPTYPSPEWLTRVIAECDGREILGYLTDLKNKRNHGS